jgi:hypothetical protein
MTLSREALTLFTLTLWARGIGRGLPGEASALPGASRPSRDEVPARRRDARGIRQSTTFPRSEPAGRIARRSRRRSPLSGPGEVDFKAAEAVNAARQVRGIPT